MSDVLFVSVLVFLQLSFPGLSFYVSLTFLLFRLQFQLLDELAPFLFYVGVFFTLAAEDSILIQLMNVESTLCATIVQLSSVITHAHKMKNIECTLLK